MATVHFSLLAQKELQANNLKLKISNKINLFIQVVGSCTVCFSSLKFVKLIVHADGDVCFNEAVCFDDFNDFVFILKKMEKALSKLRDLLNSELNDKRNVSRTIVNVVNTTVRCKKGVSESFMSVFSRISCYEDVKYFFLVALRAEIMKGEVSFGFSNSHQCLTLAVHFNSVFKYD
ncbi:hypothetical protein T12_16407 [Trichinella patagoniensis]|uniref:Uncharacterized protein n=1 Tax=Trichinella patagoniensis TaxID=990121 RepID=A0A0V0Z5W9_9BILA|nr:hypothetical protein T12_16407 [Trichinella patagoniensis]